MHLRVQGGLFCILHHKILATLNDEERIELVKDLSATQSVLLQEPQVHRITSAAPVENGLRIIPRKEVDLFLKPPVLTLAYIKNLETLPIILNDFSLSKSNSVIYRGNLKKAFFGRYYNVTDKNLRKTTSGTDENSAKCDVFGLFTG